MPDSSAPEEVRAIYGRLFGSDPLLLIEENQRIFGAQILRNLLVERGLKSAVPRGVDLAKGDSRNLIKHQRALPTTPINPKIKRQYLRSRRTRGRLTQGAIDALKPYTMVAIPDHTRDRIGDTFFVDHKIAVGRSSRSGSPVAKRLRIATVGYRVSISRLPNEGQLDEELCPVPHPPQDPAAVYTAITGYPEKKNRQKLRRTKILDRKRQEPWFEHFQAHFKHALEQGSHIVLGPEFGLPPNIEPAKVERDISELARSYAHPFFLFSGTRHEGIHNRGFAIMRGVDSAAPTERWWHYKAASARGLGENIAGPQNALVPSYKFTWPSPDDKGAPKEYRIFIPVCYDVFDPTTFINYVIGCAATDKGFYESIILVPSFNPSVDFLHALRDLSFVAACPVVYVNGLHGDAKVFIYGIAISDLVEIEQANARIKAKKRAGKKIHAKDRSGVDRSIDRAKDALLAERREIWSEMGPLQETAVPAELAESVARHLNGLQERLNRVNKKIQALENLVIQLKDLRGRGALKHLITTERCPNCRKRGHGGVAYCANDVLYYNLDIHLLDSLQQFRREYFSDDSFLPMPFTRDGKLLIQNLINAEIDARAKRQSKRTHRSQK